MLKAVVLETVTVAAFVVAAFALTAFVLVIGVAVEAVKRTRAFTSSNDKRGAALSVFNFKAPADEASKSGTGVASNVAGAGISIRVLDGASMACAHAGDNEKNEVATNVAATNADIRENTRNDGKKDGVERGCCDKVCVEDREKKTVTVKSFDKLKLNEPATGKPALNKRDERV